MTDEIFLRDPYLNELYAKVVEVDEKGIIFDKTIFYPGGGGQVHDTGFAVLNGNSYPVTYVFKSEGRIYHQIEGLDVYKGTKILLKLDWDRRYRIMKMHTSLHILGAIMYKDYNVLITGSRIYPDRARIDFPMSGMNKELAMTIVGKANMIVKEGHEVKVYFITVEQALKRSDLFRVADKSKYEKYMKDKVRIVEIVGIDVELDGGTHVKNTDEIGEIKFLKYESKGKNNRRIYITV